MAYNYSQYVTDLANLLVVPTGDTGFQTVLPNIIDDAEQRIYRELDLLNTIVRDSSAALTAGLRTFNLPSATGTFVVTEQINVVTPAGTSNPDNGTRNALVPVAKEFLDVAWNSVSGSTVPQFFAMVTQTTIIVGPWPDQGYQVEVVGTQRPAPLSSTNVTTLLTQYFPDLFMAASMVFAAGYQQNFGAAVDNPQQAVTWETHYKTLKDSAEVEEMRKKFTSQGWSPKQPAPIATPPRT